MPPKYDISKSVTYKHAPTWKKFINTFDKTFKDVFKDSFELAEIIKKAFEDGYSSTLKDYEGDFICSYQRNNAEPTEIEARAYFNE